MVCLSCGYRAKCVAKYVAKCGVMYGKDIKQDVGPDMK